MRDCPCGSGRELLHCCGPLIDGAGEAPTAVSLMRSRYSAFVLGNAGYLDATSAADRRGPVNRASAQATIDSVQWLGLTIHAVERGGIADDTGVVEFSARYREDGRIQTHRERSNFRREAGRWVYVDGVLSESAGTATGKTGRNDPCPCGSGRKYKKCCGA